MRIRIKPLLIAVIISAIPALSLAWQGKVVGISDGDTITVLRNSSPVKIRLHGIDCPEKGQAFGKRAKQFSSSIAFGKTVTIEPTDYDRYGRTVAWVYVGNLSLCEELVRNGLAWHYKKYSSDQSLSDAEEEARLSKAGLWRDDNPIPPWAYRRGVKRSSMSLAQTSEYHGNSETGIFHGSWCRYYNCQDCTEYFTNRDDALRSGYQPCRICKP